MSTSSSQAGLEQAAIAGRADAAERDASGPPIGGAYSHYALFVLLIVYVFNFVDRSIISILSEEIKADLGVGDAEMGFLYGTVFAVFYAVFGIPLARFADVWVRRSLISVGLMFWSLMTALSGFARSFPMLATFRVGVGVGEASASPAAYSMLADYYPPRLRATAIAIYSSGVYIGAGIGLFIGGWVLESWSEAFPVVSEAPLQLKGWQAAFLAVGLPGILMAVWVRTLREPVRGISEGLAERERHPAPFSVLLTELTAMMPLINLPGLRRRGASVSLNLLAGGVIALVSYALILLTGNAKQWIALGLGVYVSVGWVQSLKVRDPATFGMIFGSRALIYTTLAFPTIAFVTYGIGFWTAPLLLRLHETNAADVGLYLGLGTASGGLIGVTLGGVMADWFKQKHPAGRLLIGHWTIVGTVPLVLWMMYTESLYVAFWLNFVHHFFTSSWASVAPSTAADLVMPRMRAVAGAYFLLVNTFLGLALGPYVIGQVSDVLVAGGTAPAEALRMAMALSMLIFVPTLLFLTLAWRHLPREEASRLGRAAALGEEIPNTHR